MSDQTLSNSQCRVACVNFIMRRLSGNNAMVYVKDTLASIQLFKRAAFDLKIYLPVTACLLPFSWLLILKHSGDICLTRSRLHAFALRYDKKGFLYHLTALQIYGKEASWTHCVCEVMIGSNREYYDSIEEEHRPQGVAWPPSHENLVRKWGVIVCVGIDKITK